MYCTCIGVEEMELGKDDINWYPILHLANLHKLFDVVI